MTTAPAPLHAVRGGGRDARFARKLAQIKALWAEAWEAAEAGDTDTAYALFIEANDEGMTYPTDETRVCRVDGRVALGMAHLPFTEWGVAPVSHGRDEKRPTALDRYTGYEDGNGDDRAPARILLPQLRKGGTLAGLSLRTAEAVVAALGLEDPDAQVRVEWSRTGVVELHRHVVPAGPQPVAEEG